VVIKVACAIGDKGGIMMRMVTRSAGIDRKHWLGAGSLMHGQQALTGQSEEMG
jgi:hypothetical protein